jgi:hypothetical protein
MLHFDGSDILLRQKRFSILLIEYKQFLTNKSFFFEKNREILKKNFFDIFGTKIHSLLFSRVSVQFRRL